MENFKVNILGVEYKVLVNQSREDYPLLEEADGFTDFTTKKIIIEKLKTGPRNWEDMDSYFKQVLRHEIVHAFLHESGLDSNTDWARNEEIVDWIAIQFPKLKKTFKEAQEEMQ